MGATKKEQYSARQLYFARIAKAVGHPARIAILQYLARIGYASNQTLTGITELAEATVHQHLQELLRVGLVEENFMENRHYYFLRHQAIEHIHELQQVLETEWD